MKLKKLQLMIVNLNIFTWDMWFFLGKNLMNMSTLKWF